MWDHFAQLFTILLTSLIIWANWNSRLNESCTGSFPGWPANKDYWGRSNILVRSAVGSIFGIVCLSSDFLTKTSSLWCVNTMSGSLFTGELGGTKYLFSTTLWVRVVLSVQYQRLRLFPRDNRPLHPFLRYSRLAYSTKWEPWLEYHLKARYGLYRSFII